MYHKLLMYFSKDPMELLPCRTARVLFVVLKQNTAVLNRTSISLHETSRMHRVTCMFRVRRMINWMKCSTVYIFCTLYGQKFVDT